MAVDDRMADGEQRSTSRGHTGEAEQGAWSGVVAVA